MSKKCLGCLQEVAGAQGVGVATICDNCRVDLQLIPPQFVGDSSCHNCGGKANLIGALAFTGTSPPWELCLYFDCPQAQCGKRRVTIQQTGLFVARALS